MIEMSPGGRASIVRPQPNVVIVKPSSETEEEEE